jgi:hypothetical protein
MSVRSWAVGVVSAAAVVAGVVVVQSGIPGTAALPVLPHRAAAPAPAADGTELPAPTEAGAPPPAAGMVRTVSRASVPQRRTAVPTARPPDRSGKGSGEDSADSGNGSAKDAHGKDGGHRKDQGDKSGKDG